MDQWLENRCRELIARQEYEECSRQIAAAMQEQPHSAVPHNLMGILMEQMDRHALAMQHFRAAAALDPTYLPAHFNLEQYNNQTRACSFAFSEEDCGGRSVSGSFCK